MSLLSWSANADGPIPGVSILPGDCRTSLAGLPAGCVQTAITSPPFLGLRNYGTDPQTWADGAVCELGGEKSLAEYVAHIVEVMRAVRRVLHPTGTLWLNLGDSYSNAGQSGNDRRAGQATGGKAAYTPIPAGLGPKQLLGVPYRVAFALQDAGWIWRQTIPWVKRQAMPDSCEDRPATSIEMVLLLTPGPRTYLDMAAASAVLGLSRHWRSGDALSLDAWRELLLAQQLPPFDVLTANYAPAHFATWPPALVEPMLLSSTSARGACPRCAAPYQRITERTPMLIRNGPKAGGYGSATTDGLSGTMLAPASSRHIGWQPGCACNAGPPVPCRVLDPFAGSGTTLAVAKEWGRAAIGCELQPDYLPLIEQRLAGVTPRLFCDPVAGGDVAPRPVQAGFEVAA